MDIKQLLRRLEHYRKVNPRVRDEDDYGDDRHNFCHLIYLDKVTKKAHRFQVRGWSYDMLMETLNISVVNWTMLAGTGSLTLKNVPEELAKWVVAEDDPTLAVLYGNN